MSKSDIEQVAQLEKDIFSDPWSASAFQEIIEDESWGCYVAVSDCTVVGYGCYYVVDVESHLANIAVATDYRRKSVAKRLLEIILQKVSERDCEYIFLEVRPSNTVARAFYEKYGFKLLYRRPRYYHHPEEDALVMVRYLKKETE